MVVRKSLSTIVSFLPLLLRPLPLPVPMPMPSSSPPSSPCLPMLLTIFPSSWSTMLWASRMPCATWSWLQGRTKKRMLITFFFDWPVRGRKGCIHALSFIGYLRSDNCITDPFHCRTGDRDIRLRFDGVVDYGLLRWMFICG